MYLESCALHGRKIMNDIYYYIYTYGAALDTSPSPHPNGYRDASYAYPLRMPLHVQPAVVVFNSTFHHAFWLKAQESSFAQ